MLFEIWQPKNNNKYDKSLIPQYTIINKINVQLQRILKKHKLNDTLHQFRNQFCINEAVAEIENNSLITTKT